MDLSNLDVLKKFLSRYHIRPSEKLGQNFLVDRRVLNSIVAAAEPRPSDVVLEIGAGLGTLTVELAQRVGRVLAVEKDKRLIPPLKFILKKFTNAKIFNSDILDINLPEVFGMQSAEFRMQNSKFKNQNSPFKVVANIPYYITGEILRLLLSVAIRPELIVLLVQKEVAQRLVAAPGQMSILAISVQFYGKPELVCLVPSASFWPEPKVDSAILKIAVYNKPIFDIDEKGFFRFVKIGFSARRKTLLNNLSSGWRLPKQQAAAILEQAGVDPGSRAQELGLKEWERIYKAYEKSRL